MEQEDQTVLAAATAATAQLAVKAAQAFATAAFKEQFPQEKQAMIAVVVNSNDDGTHTASVRLGVELSGPTFDPALEKYMAPIRVGEAREKMRAIMAPTLERCGFKYFKSRNLFRRTCGDQIHEVLATCTKYSSFSIFWRIYLTDLAAFYKTFETDPRSTAHFPAHSDYLPSQELMLQAFPKGPPYLGNPYDPLAPVIVASLEQKILPWFDRHPSLAAIKNVLEARCNIYLNHETLLALYFLSKDQMGLKRYVQLLQEKMMTEGQPRPQDFVPFYQKLSAKYPQFFVALDEISADDARTSTI